MSRMAIGRALVAVLAVLAGACGSGTGPTTDLILNGTWSGTLGAGTGGGRALRITWTISQDGTRLSGPVTVSTSPAVLPLDFAGTLTGSINRSQITVMSLAARNGSSACAINGTGSGTATLIAIDGTLDVTFAGCDGLDVQPPNGNHVTLTKQ